MCADWNKKLLKKFFGIAFERVGRLNAAFLELEQNPSNSFVADEAMREIHTLKGEAKMLGMEEVNGIAHKTEELMLFARSRGFVVEPPVSDLTLAGYDAIAELLQRGGRSDRVDVGEFATRVDRLLAEQSAGAAEVPPSEAPVETPVEASQQAASTTAASLSREASLDRGPGENAQPSRSQGNLKKVLDQRDENSIRVDVESLDTLSALAGDIFQDQSRREYQLGCLTQISSGLMSHLRSLQVQLDTAGRLEEASPKVLSQLGQKILQWSRQQEELLSGLRRRLNKSRDEVFESGVRIKLLERTVRTSRLVPLSSLLEQYPRSARDLAKSQQKEVRVELAGSEIRLDKQVLERIGEPLLHLVRNSVDHGLERPERRQQLGKATTGLLFLGARQRGNKVEIEVRDDGRGIDLERICRVALEQNLITEEQSTSMSPDEILQLLFSPGFTTRKNKTDVSGRGIGLDVVKQHIESLGGTVHVLSSRGTGCRFRLTVPITVSFTKVLVFETDSSSFAVVSELADQITEVTAEELVLAGSSMAFHNQGELVPLIDLGRILGIDEPLSLNGSKRQVVLLKHQGRRLGLLVHNVSGERKVVQRSLSAFVQGVPLIAGTVSLDHGGIAFLLSVPELLDASGEASRRWDGEQRNAAAKAQVILVVDDSEMTRDLVVSVLKENNYNIVEAVNGKEALQRAQDHSPVLVITDLEMPVMDGFGLVRALRSTEGQRDVPVIVFSTRGSESDKRQAMEIGADAYLVKSHFSEKRMLELVRRFLPAQ